jgi:hypothetical protein
MKKINSILACLLLTASLFLTQQVTAQAPQKMSYQSVIRNSNNVLLADTAVGIKISVLQGTALGTAVYEETQTATTNSNGLLSLQIGTGTVISGTFANINWAAGPYFIKTETDPAGGSNYSITGTQEILSVPYALHAKTADSLTGATTLTIGQSYQGGKIFWLDATGQHGLIAAISDQSTGVRWYGGTNTNTRARGDGIGAGLKNTAIIIANQGPVDGAAFAATVCNEYSVTVAGVTYGDWYLPSKHELYLLYLNSAFVGGFAPNFYWSSTEYDNVLTWYQGFGAGGGNVNNKNITYYVRAIRAF